MRRMGADELTTQSLTSAPKDEPRRAMCQWERSAALCTRSKRPGN